MSAEKIATYSGFWRILIFVFALRLHVATICFFSIQQKEEAVETIDFRETEVFKLVDVQEYIKPLVQEKTFVVVNQPKASDLNCSSIKMVR